MARLAGVFQVALVLEICFYPIFGLGRKAKPEMKMPYKYLAKRTDLFIQSKNQSKPK
jgi:hypothetical protein